MDTSTQTLAPNPLEQPQVADTPKAEQQSTPEMAEAVSVERLREDVQATLARAEKTRDRINSIELPHGDSPRLQELKQQSEAVFKKLEQLVFAMMDTERTAQDQSRLQKLTTEVKRDLKAMKQPLNQEEARASKPVVKEAPEPEPQQAEIPTTTIEPEPVIEAPKPIETYDRDTFWRDIKTSLHERPESIELLKEAQLKIAEQIIPQISVIEARLKKSESRQETPENLVRIITDLQTQLGGPAYASEIEQMLTRLTTDPNERRSFGHISASTIYDKIKSKTGVEGVARDLRLAKEKASTNFGIQKLKDKFASVFQFSEVNILEKNKMSSQQKCSWL